MSTAIESTRTYSHHAVKRSGRHLAAYMLELQTATFDATGVMPVVSDVAPSTYPELLQCGARWQYALGDVFLPIWNGASDSSIYGSNAANYAFRYWHDMGHIAHHCSFTGPDELRLQTDYHLPIIARRFGVASLAYALYYADTVGQLEYLERHGMFPDDQLAFAMAYVNSGKTSLRDHLVTVDSIEY